MLHGILGMPVVLAVSLLATMPLFDGWTPGAPRDEIAPQFAVVPDGGPGGSPALEVRTGDRPGQDGWWRKTFTLGESRYYRFSCLARCENVPHPLRSVFVQITFTDDNGRLVRDHKGELVQPVIPDDYGVQPNGWRLIARTYEVPEGATRAVVDLKVRWVRNARVLFSEVSLEPSGPPERRLVRLAAVHYRPEGTQSPAENYEAFGRFVKQAAEQGADLIVLPEAINYFGMSRYGKSYADVAEPIPGPATSYFAQIADEYDTYIVVPVIERDAHLVYNSAALVGPDGEIVGVYRKVCLPREEYNRGICPGTDYPVFQTRFGKVGIMICWDIHFPEVARQLQYRGAEVIAVPIWGGMPLLCAARALENQVYLVTSTYTDVSQNWMVTGIWGPTGEVLKQATSWGSVVMVEVDLNRHEVNWFNIGDFKSRIPHERPYASPN